MSSKTCPAFGMPCVKEKCLAYIPLQTEVYEHRGLWDKLTKRGWKYNIIDYVTIGRCTLLNIDFRVYARDDSEFFPKGE